MVVRRAFNITVVSDVQRVCLLNRSLHRCRYHIQHSPRQLDHPRTVAGPQDSCHHWPLCRWLRWSAASLGMAFLALAHMSSFLPEAFMELVQCPSTQTLLRYPDGPAYLSRCLAGTFVARPLSPLMRTALVTSITNIRRQQAQQGVELLSEVSWDFERVLKATGPVAFTDFCVRAVQKESKGTVNEPFFWGLLYDQKEPVQVGGVVVLPIKGGWRGSGGGGPDDVRATHLRGF